MRLFVSYSHQDSPFVQQFISDLERQNFEVWVDREDIHGGEAWRRAIVEGIDTCEAFLVVLSPNSVVSRNVVKEISMADERGKRIFPVVYQPCKIPPDMEYQLTGVQYCDFTTTAYPTAFSNLISALRGTPPPPPPPPFQVVGTWQVQLQNQFTGLMGYGQYSFAPSGQFNGTLNTPQGAMQAQGQWRLAGQQLALQGVHSYSLMPYNVMPYAFMMQITDVGDGAFYGVTSGGEQVTFQRIG